MNTIYGTTPFGRRPMSLAMLAAQKRAQAVTADLRRGKWALFRAVCEARPLLGLTDRALTVLDALLTFYPEDELAEENGLVVFPSNAQLSLRARAMTPATLRRHLAGLVDAGLIARKDSPNGKRYARRDSEGEIGEAFGFSLAPLLARAGEIEAMAAQVVADRQALRVLRERVTLCRRDISKLITAAMEEGLPGDWTGKLMLHRGLVLSLPRVPTVETLTPILHEMEKLRAEIVNILEDCDNTENMSGNESQIERHKQNSNSNSPSESEPRFETKQEAGAGGLPDSAPLPDGLELKMQRDKPQANGQAAKTGGTSVGGPAFPLPMVLQACTQISDYGPDGAVRNWRDMMAAAVVVRSMLGVSASAYEAACDGMGPENAAIVIACILERAGHISSAGGYLRDLTRRSQRGEFALGPMVMALLRANGKVSAGVA